MNRIYSLDVLRGVAIMIMIFVDAPPGVAYPIFVHAPWAGLTFADFAFPGFVFAMGLSAAVSMVKRKSSTKKILKRAALLFAIGILFNTLPFIFAYLIQADFSAANFYEGAIEHFRVFGILQRLALTYASGIFIVRAIRNDFGILVVAFVLLILSSAGFHLYAPDNPFNEAHNISRAVDYIFPGENHIYLPSHDPEGLYGTIASTASFLFGFAAGRVLIDNVTTTKKKIFLLCSAGIFLLIAGGLWNLVDIVAKRLWTAPFALITSGVEIFLLTALVYLFDKIPRFKNFFRPLCAVGMNPLFFFLASNITLCLLYIFPSPIEGVNLYFWIFQKTFYQLISPEFGSMIFCVLWCLIWLPLAEIFYRRGIVIKI